MKKIIICITVLMVFGTMAKVLFAAQTLIARKVEEVPIIGGKADDRVWEKAQAIVTHDGVADIDIVLKTIYTDKEFFFLISFPDLDESRAHKSWVWDKARELYKIGNDREDTFIFKWNMDPEPVDLSIYADNSYKTDVWFWKACRTDQMGFADDKTHILSFAKMEGAVELIGRTGVAMYLLRKGDAGQAVYKTKLQVEYIGDVLPRYTYRIPSGSRADVKAKGIRENGGWTIEFGRVLNTGYNDDIQFNTTGSYQFGISRFEIAGRALNPELTQPRYGSGNVSEELTLVFSQ